MSSTDSFNALMEGLRAGDSDAAARVFARFVNQLVALVRSRLTESVRSKVSAEDVLQSVFRSFFTRQRAGQFDVDNWDSLWGILTVITLRKCGHQLAYHHAACRNVKREVSEEETVGKFLAREPTPPEAAALTDMLEHLMRGLEERDRQILTLHLQGYTRDEISDRVGCAERTIRRTIERIRKRLHRLYEKDKALA